MSDTAPRRAPVGRTVYVDYETGFEVSEAQYSRIEKLLDAAEVLYQVMHDVDGSVMPGEHQDHSFSGTRMKRAADSLDLAMMLARRAALEVK